jgi:hypothetical protein
MSEFEDFNRRLGVLEEEVRQLRHDAPAVTVAQADAAAARSDASAARSDASAARILAAGAHKDVGDALAKWDAHIQTLNALREDQIDMRKRMDEGFAQVNARMDESFTKINLGMAQIVALLTVKEDEEKED